jgi:hypothetical protein
MPRWLKITIGIFALILIGFGVLLYMSGTPVDDLGRLVSDGAVVELREPMRPQRVSGPRVLILAMDGVGDAEFRKAAIDGRIPRMAGFLGTIDTESDTWQHAYVPRGALSILPSTTYAAWTAVFTGEPVGIAGVSGNEWFDRQTRKFLAPAPVSVSGYGDAVRVYSDGLLHDWIAVPTLFELADVRSIATLVAQHRGADLLVQPHPGFLADLVAGMTAGVAEDDESEPDVYSSLDRQAVRKTLEAFEEHGIPDLSVIYFPGIDLYTHVAQPALEEKVEYLSDVTDPLVGEILDAYADAGLLDETYVIFVADHGHTPTLDTDLHALGTGDDEEWPEIIRRAGFRVRPFERETDDDDADFQAVFAYQGAFAYLYLADRSTCPAEGDVCAWEEAPRMDEDVLAVARALHEANQPGGEIPEIRGTLDLIFAREPRGLAPADPFQVFNGEALVPVGEYLSQHPRPDLLDLERRLDELASGPLGHRVGDVLLLSRYRFEDPIDQRFYFSRKYRSWHGSPSAQDSEILWILARANDSGERLREIASRVTAGSPDQLHITPLALHLLSLTE